MPRLRNVFINVVFILWKIFNNLLHQIKQRLNQQMIQAISGFAAAINGGQSGKNITLSLGGGGGAAA